MSIGKDVLSEKPKFTMRHDTVDLRAGYHITGNYLYLYEPVKRDTTMIVKNPSDRYVFLSFSYLEVMPRRKEIGFWQFPSVKQEEVREWMRKFLDKHGVKVGNIDKVEVFIATEPMLEVLRLIRKNPQFVNELIKNKINPADYSLKEFRKILEAGKLG